MKVLISGSSGLVGSSLSKALLADGHQVLRLVRRPSQDPDTIFWDPMGGRLEATDLIGVDAVVHLAGENIAGGRWTENLKARIFDSRVEGTRVLVRALSEMENPPSTLISASAIGFYGDRGDAWVDEESDPGFGFLAEVCRAWEAAAEPIERHGVRLVRLRIGVVLSPRGGALKKMLLPFKLGIGGRLGSGNQYISWISLEDLVRTIQHALAETAIQGALNAVAPEPVTNRQLTTALSQTLGRPALFPAPTFGLRALLGEMADEMLLASTRVKSAKLSESGFVFEHSEIRAALSEILGEK